MVFLTDAFDYEKFMKQFIVYYAFSHYLCTKYTCIRQILVTFQASVCPFFAWYEVVEPFEKRFM